MLSIREIQSRDSNCFNYRFVGRFGLDRRGR
jgi:hypothetical protein